MNPEQFKETSREFARRARERQADFDSHLAAEGLDYTPPRVPDVEVFNLGLVTTVATAALKALLQSHRGDDT